MTEREALLELMEILRWRLDNPFSEDRPIEQLKEKFLSAEQKIGRSPVSGQSPKIEAGEKEPLTVTWIGVTPDGYLMVKDNNGKFHNLGGTGKNPAAPKEDFNYSSWQTGLEEGYRRGLEAAQQTAANVARVDGSAMAAVHAISERVEAWKEAAKKGDEND